MDLGADLNIGENRDTPLCVAVQSKNKKMVECLLEHNITNVNIREALKLSWELKEDFIAGLLLEHIAVDRSRDAVNLSGLELEAIKPQWILPSLGVRSLPKERQQYQRHRKQRSLGHVQELLSYRRKSIATENPIELENVTSLVPEKSNMNMKSRRLSVPMSSLKYVSDTDSASDLDSVDFASKQNLSGIQEDPGKHLHPAMSPPTLEVSIMEECDYSEKNAQLLSSHLADDSGVETLRTMRRQQSSESGLSESDRSEGQTGGSSRGSQHRQVHRTVSGAATLPYCTLEQYAGDRKGEESSTNTLSVHADRDITLSPAQLIRKYRRRPKKIRKQLFSESLGSSTQADTPVPVMYYADQLEGWQKSVVPTGSIISSDRPFSPGSTSWANSTTGAGTDFSSSQMFGTTSSRDEIDFGGRQQTLRESSFNEQHRSHLIKILDLSSNKLCNLNDLCYMEYGGPFVFQRLKELASLDLKQNRLSELAKQLMQVYRYSGSGI